jgi:DNA-binding NarL/FixJ family response regulator
LERTRILLVEMPHMLRDIVVGVLADQPDMEVVGEETAMNGLPETVVDAGADVVVIGRDDPSLARTLLERVPRLRVLAVTAGGHDSWLYELLPHRVPLGEISPKRLVEEIRKRAGDGAEWWAR